MMGKQRLAFALSSIVVLLLTAACGDKEVKQEEQAVDRVSFDPNTSAELVFHANNGDSEESFNKLYGDVLRKKFPNFTIKYFRHQTGQKLPELLAQGQRIDILFAAITNYFDLLAQGKLEYDMTDLARRHGVDLASYQPTLVDGVKHSGVGKLYGLPVTNMVQVMFYNKGIFDKFGVAYPKDGMTWDETIELSKKLTRSEGGKLYIGFAASPGSILGSNPFSQPYVDPKTQQPTFTVDIWRKLIDTIFVQPAADQVYKQRVTELKRIPYRTEFTNTQELAMFTFNSQFPFQVPDDMQKLEWDLVALPTFKEKPKTGSQGQPYLFGVTSMAANKDAAMEAIKYLASPDVQMSYSRQGIMTVINDETVKKAHGQDSPFKDKNWQALYVNELAPLDCKSQYKLAVEAPLTKAVPEIVRGDKDTNTALREVQEAAEKAVAELQRN